MELKDRIYMFLVGLSLTIGAIGLFASGDKDMYPFGVIFGSAGITFLFGPFFNPFGEDK